MKDAVVPCNSKALAGTVVRLGEKPAMVQLVIKGYLSLTADIISGGSLESIEIPNFGKFKVKEEKLYHKERRKTLPKTLTNEGNV